MATASSQADTTQAVAWLPQAKQFLALSCPIFELFYGGAVGGGKTDYLLADYLRGTEGGPGHKGIFFRRTYPELEDTILRSRAIYEPIGGVFAETKKTWHFPGGATLRFRHLDSDADVGQYQNDAFTWMGWDQLTNWPTDYAYVWMMSRIRSADGLSCRVRSAGNPGGRGHQWVKMRFIDPVPPCQVYADPESGIKRVFLPAKLEDNIKLTSKDPEYETRLKMTSAHLYRAFRFGDWDIIAGQVFSEIRRADQGVQPYALHPSCYRFAAMDWGYAKPFSIGWWAVDHDGRMIRYREWYGCEPGKHNVGIQMPAPEVAKKAWDLSVGEGCQDMVADPACWGKDSEGNSVADRFTTAGWRMVPGHNSRKLGWERVHELLKLKGLDGRPMMEVFTTCTAWWRTFPALVADEHQPEDVDTKQEDHVADETRYAVMSEFAQRTARAFDAPDQRRARVKKDWNPLEY